MSFRKFLFWFAVVVIVLGVSGAVAWSTMGDGTHDALSGIWTFLVHAAGKDG